MWYQKLLDDLIKLFSKPTQPELIFSPEPADELVTVPTIAETRPAMLSPNFEVRELEVSDTAARKNISNKATGEVLENLEALCIKILEPVRLHYRMSVKVTSGYRSPKINKLVGGVSNSQHVVGEAADFTVKGRTVKEVYEYIKNSDLPYDQLIDEYGVWVHVSHKRNGHNRRQAFLKR